MHNHYQIGREIRSILGGEDAFNRGHQILKERRVNRRAPAWTKSDSKVQALLLRSFPLMESDPKQHKRASRWLRVTYLYFRLGLTYSQVAYEMRLKPKTVQNTVQSIRYSAAGLQANGNKKPVGVKPRGRPKRYVKII